ncbi:MAG: hypothetical protein WCN87_00325 [Chlamydiota bacterium]
MPFLINNLLIFCVLFFVGCEPSVKIETDTQAETLWIEARYFQESGEELVARKKAVLALSYTKSPLMKAQIEVFLEGDSSLMDTLEEGFEKETLLGESFYIKKQYPLALIAYEKALNAMEMQLSDLYERRNVIITEALGVYQQRLAIRLVQLKIAEVLLLLDEKERALDFIRKVVLHKSWQDVYHKVLSYNKGDDSSLLSDTNLGHTAADFSRITQAREHYLLKRSWELASRNGCFQ